MEFRRDREIEFMNVPDFWTRVRSAEFRFLGLDYDGTLAPFHVDPLEARPFPGVKETLKALQETKNTTLAIISGRPVVEVQHLLGNLGITIVGSHGFELLRTDGALLNKQPSVKQQEGLRKARNLAIRLGVEKKLEPKIASIAFHTRGMNHELCSRLQEQISAAWLDLSDAHELECRKFNGGIEIRATGWHKGDALSSLLAVQPGGTFAVYIGDDETDEDAFRRIQTYGVGLKVGTPAVPTAALGFLADCQAVFDFLTTWLTITSTAQKGEVIWIQRGS
jgi:trehalose 6-phosphate phosphatase